MEGFAVSLIIKDHNPVGIGHLSGDTGEYKELSIHEAKELQYNHPESFCNIKNPIGEDAIEELDQLPRFNVDTGRVNKNIYTVLYKAGTLYYISDHKGNITITSSVAGLKLSNMSSDGSGDYIVVQDEATQNFNNQMLMGLKVKFTVIQNRLKVLEDMTGEDLAMPEGIVGFTTGCWAESGKLRALQLPSDMKVLPPNSLRGLVVDTLILPSRIKLSAGSFNGATIDRLLIRQGVIVDKGAFSGGKVGKVFGNTLSLKQVRSAAPPKTKFYSLSEYGE